MSIFWILKKAIERARIINNGNQEHLIMPPTAQDVYNQVIQDLPPNERLRLATLILNELVQQESQSIDHSDTWAEQDQTDIVNFSLQYADSLFPEEETV
jgi:hypothetical protein